MMDMITEAASMMEDKSVFAKLHVESNEHSFFKVRSINIESVARFPSSRIHGSIPLM